MDDTTTKCGALIRVQSVMGQLTPCHPTNGMNEVSSIEIFKTILVRVVGVGPMEEIMCRGVLDTILIMSIL